MLWPTARQRPQILAILGWSMCSMHSHRLASFEGVLHVNVDMSVPGPTPAAKIVPWKDFASMMWPFFSKSGPFEATI